MSQENLCHLCVKISQEHRCLYNEHGDENENYQLIKKYFTPDCLFRGKELELTTVCLSCWRQIYGFYNFQVSIYQAQKNLLENVEVFHILDLEPPQQGKANENQEINIKDEQEFLPEDGYVTNSDIHIVEGFTITEIRLPAENNFEPIEIGSVPPNNEICFPVDENSTISYPQLEIRDTYCIDEISEDGLSDEYDQDVSYLNYDSREQVDSMGITPGDEHLEGIFSARPRSNKHSALSLQESDDLIAHWKQNLHCELCSAKCTTYSLLRKHFQFEHPLEKCSVTCCKRIFYHRYRLEEHIRIHLNPNAFKCELCEKTHTNRHQLIKHMRTYHMQNKEKMKIQKKGISKKDLNELVAQWMPTLECVVCKKMSPTLSQLQLHFRQHHRQKQFQLECCQRRFKRRNEIEEHMRLHIDPNALKCNVCHKPFKTERYLHAHLRNEHGIHAHLQYVHSQEKRKPKRILDVKMDKLMAHVDFADHAKVCLRCVVCSEVAPTYSLLRKHFRTKHRREKFYILCCQQKISLRWKIENHVRLHIDPNIFKCDLCDKRYKEIRNLIGHKRSSHNIDDEANKPSSKNSKSYEAETRPIKSENR